MSERGYSRSIILELCIVGPWVISRIRDSLPIDAHPFRVAQGGPGSRRGSWDKRAGGEELGNKSSSSESPDREATNTSSRLRAIPSDSSNLHLQPRLQLDLPMT